MVRVSFLGIALYLCFAASGRQLIYTKDSVDSLIRLGEVQARRDLKKSNSTFSLAEKILGANDPRSIIALSNIAINYNRLGNRDSSRHYFRLADSLRQKYLNHTEAQFVYFISLSMMHKSDNQFPEAIDDINKILTHSSLKELPKMEADAYHQLGVIFHIVGQNESAMKYYEKALTVLNGYPDKLIESFCLHQIGLLMHNQYDFLNAEKYYLKSIALQKTLDDRKAMAIGLSNLAGLYRETNRLDQSLYPIEASIRYASELGEVRLLNNCKVIKCLILSDLNREKEAVELMNECLETAKRLNHLNQYSYILTELAEIDFKKKKITEARRKLELSIVAAEQSKRADPRLNAYELYFQVLNEQKEFEKAIQVNIKFQKIKDSINSVRGIEKLKVMEAEQRLKSQTDEIALLSANQKIKEVELKKQRAIQMGIGFVLLSVIAISIIIINRQRALARVKRNLELEKIRNRIARDLHDDLGSSLSAIKVLSQTGLTKESQSHQNLNKINIKATSLLDSMSDMVWTVDAGNDSLAELIAHMREYASETLEPVEMEYNLSINANQNIKLTLEQRKNLYLIFKEAINNAVKYSDAKKIEIALNANSKLELTVADDGSGFDPLTINYGNGIKNFEVRAREIGGAMQLTSSPGQGTSIYIAAPLT
jgi:two-component system, NarL family, sensor histidine kinase UhpB